MTDKQTTMTPKRPNRAHRLLAILEQHPGVWLSVYDFLDRAFQLCGTQAISEARKLIEPFGGKLENRLEHGTDAFGWPQTKSFYRYTPGVRPGELFREMASAVSAREGEQE